MNYLTVIKERKIKEVAELQSKVTINELKEMPFFTREPISLKSKFLDTKLPGVICEFKRASPSKGFINKNADLVKIVSGYEDAGAFCVSVLTDKIGFEGSLDDLITARNTIKIPILRKDFIIDPYQIIEAKASGADIILLIAACLEKEEVLNFSEIAKDLGLEILLEIHEERELEYLNDKIDILGINNRNLKTFKVDLQISRDIAKLNDVNLPMISESGITTIDEILELASLGFNGFLIGENFMKSDDPAFECKNFLAKINSRVV